MDRTEHSMDYVTETAAAILLSDGDKQHWIPKSLIENLEIQDGLAIFTIPEWFASKRGFI